ncbi:pyridoxal-phosphate dependent enzyme [Actinophytocola sp.]|uniref:threonine synthase n=1 Tax=Actinophytocola sp. TaxID=1872138 RepID=UPI00389A5A76
MTAAMTSLAPSLRKDVVLECRVCGFEEPTRFVTRCPRCAGATDVLYDLSRATVRDDPNPLIRWFDLLPFADAEQLYWMGDGDTPLVHARELGARAGLTQLYLKDETANPSRSAKDRMASVAVSFLAQRGVREFVVSSTGNSSTSMGLSVSRVPEITLHIFCGADFLDRVNVPDTRNVSVYCTDTDFVGAAKAAARFAADNGLPFEGGFFNPGRREGLKLAYLEAFDQLAPREPDVVVQAISSGMGVYGAYKGVMEYRAMGRLRGLPRIVCAQQQRCAPMYRAFHDDAETIRPEHIEKKPRGVAKAILRGDPTDSYPFMRSVVLDTAGTFEAVSDDEIHAAQHQARELEGLDMCLSSSVALASTLKLARTGWIRPDEVVLVNITGADRPPVPPTNITRVTS